MKAATPPRRWASAMMCWQTVVLPEDSGPKISVIRPRGIPPTPSARSRAIEPVEMTSTAWRSFEPSFMIEPRPNCFSIARIAASTALVRSVPLPRESVPRSIMATYLAPLPLGAEQAPVASARSLVLRLLGPGLALGLPDLDVGRRLQHGLDLGL